MEKKAHLVENFLCDLWNDKSKSSKEELFVELFSSNLIIDSPIAKEVGSRTLLNVSNCWMQGFPDMQVGQIELELFGDIVITNWRSRATHLSTFKGIEATGKKIDYPGETIFFFKENKIVRYFCKIDMVEVYNQLGLRLAKRDYEGQDILSQNKALLIANIQANFSEGLTKREVELMSLYLMGFNAKQIGRFCSISHRTVETHLSRALQELGCQNKHQCLEKIVSSWMLPIFQDLAKLVLEQYGVAKKSLSLS